ncbi:hypothetical protein SCLCIDRAFT_18643 [Scleroderma citrinum Foug A]|uniref:CxC2-like cysteine cluster KDZ transposase-associated domain-containing protein n=1 Tax=Scleroderma citrinum Foug A TaxID=1036808 RepID=A0A0C3EQV0_9AGAM|nr:hypothetical protein SCLCIDRAFT_18643 [Scleroderma citrinum Foug A]
MNYYSKLPRLTSNAFPLAVPDRYKELLRVSRSWRLLKLLKWQGFHGRSVEPGAGELVLFCPACPQPGVNVPLVEEVDLNHWKYSRIIAMDGNFKAEHMLLKRPADELWLMNGKGFMVTAEPYKTYLAQTANRVEKSDCSNHHAVNQTNTNRSQLASTGIGGCACARHGCFIPHAMVDFQRGEQQVNMDYALAYAVHHGMGYGQQVINFYDINSLSLNRKLKAAHQHLVSSSDAFANLDATVPGDLREMWKEQERKALAERLSNPKAMDIFEVQLKKAPSIKSVEMNLIEMQAAGDAPQGCATWMARALKVEEAQQSQINGLVQATATFLGADWDSDLIGLQEGHTDEDDTFITVSPGNAEGAILPLPSYIGLPHCGAWGLNCLIKQELQLHQGQANDALHEIQLSLADKAMLYRTDVRHGRNYTMTSRTWKKVADLDATVTRHTAVYHRCRKQMVALGADSSILDQYQPLDKKDLIVSTTVTEPNARGHRHDSLAWFWTMDIPKDTNRNDWMSEFYHVHWLRAKAKQDRWVEEVELLVSEHQWTHNFFNHRAGHWAEQAAEAAQIGDRSLGCYAARQCDMYNKLGRLCK